MPDTNTPEQTPKPNRARPFHQPFSWIDDAARTYPAAEFFALTVDVCNGICTCLEIIEASDPECRCDAEPDDDEAELPMVSAYHAGILRRLSIVSARLLREHAELRIAWINEHAVAQLEALKEPDK